MQVARSRAFNVYDTYANCNEATFVSCSSPHRMGTLLRTRVLMVVDLGQLGDGGEGEQRVERVR
eukprot:4113017-Prymnesium_polylepis.1